VLSRFDVVLWPDNDEAGAAHMHRIADVLLELGVQPRWFAPAGLPAGGDAADWCGTAEELGRALAEASPYENREAGADPPARQAGRASQAMLLVELAARVELFHNADGVAYVRLEQGGHREVWPLESKAVRSWLSREFWQQCGRAPGAQAVQNALNVLLGQALHEGPERPVYVRLAPGEGDTIYLDLGNPSWEAVRISAQGWEVVVDPPVRFRRPKGLLALPQPVHGGNLALLRRYLNVADESQWLLVVGWLLFCFRPTGPYPSLSLQGEHGSAKSTAARVLRRLVDPNKAPARAAPRDERDLAIAASNGAVVSLDNLSSIPDWLSDALCRASTGLGFGTRTLYEAEEETLWDVCRPVILNGIGTLGTRHDLLDRTIGVELPPIPDDRRQTEEMFWANFERDAGAILGGLLDAVVCALARLPNVQLPRLPRMADFARWVVAAEPALGCPPGAFLAAYADARAHSHEIVLDAAVIVPPLRTLLLQGAIVATATELLDRLAGVAGEAATHRRDWPSTPVVLGRQLTRLAPALRAVGIEVERTHDAEGRQLLRITAQPTAR
jgi:hypothetical protein